MNLTERMEFWPKSDKEWAAALAVVAITILAICASIANCRRMDRIAKGSVGRRLPK